MDAEVYRARKGKRTATSGESQGFDKLYTIDKEVLSYERFCVLLSHKVYFGKASAAKALKAELRADVKTVMLAYGGGSIKKNGIYDELTSILWDAGKKIVEFSGIMSNPTYAKVQMGAKLAREQHVDMVLGVGGGSVIDCCKMVAAQAKMDRDLWEMGLPTVDAL